ncbi:MAG TPA: TfpX/TfpZ family type IV pilin accessory protein [Albitalea sp.]|uniref:TfpX/TfpZ family type IV pilin accessory protein n=1 Tax=Piscinibacter sp. TaxID=1903157 RepID=UPI002ED352C7
MNALRSRLLAAGIHLIVSAVIAVGVAVIILGLWYPGDLGDMAGGRRLFLLVLGVDVVMGPLLTLVVFNTRKPRSELVRDLSVIAALQMAALAYGLYTVYIARPVALAYEGARFRLVIAYDVRVEELPMARVPYQKLSLTGPLIVGVRAAKSGEERLESLDLAFKGYDIGQRPSLWQPYADSRAAAYAEAKTVEQLMSRYPARRSELEAKLRELGLTAVQARYVPVLARGDWVAILDGNGDVQGYAPFDGF